MQSHDYTYVLPPDRIASVPLAERDASKLLVADAVHASIEHRTFRELPSILPERSILVVNRTRVIAARLLVRKPSGGQVEVFLSQPVRPSTDPSVVLHSSEPSEWECIIGGRNVHVGMELQHGGVDLRIQVLERHGNEGIVRLTWDDGTSLADVVERAGVVPLPPYIHREATVEDRERYQTVYATEEGSVAAPTAGLHLTTRVMDDLSARGIERIEVVLHVGLGTFAPMHAGDVREHVMHRERFGIDRASIRALADAAARSDAWITVVGTTSLRTLESLFYVGARLSVDANAFPPGEVDVPQWAAFEASHADVSRAAAFIALGTWMDAHGMDMVWGTTQIMLIPEAHIATADALITNFHQPGTTLMLLVAAFVGGAWWRNIYDAALENDYRFLSYGDSSLLLRSVVRST